MEHPLVFDIPDKDNRIGGTQRNQSVWVDIFVPCDLNDAPPGIYSGQLTVSWPGGGRCLDVELTVWDFALPDKTHCRGDIYNRTLLKMDGDQELGYYHMAHQHRFHPGVPAYRPEIHKVSDSFRAIWTECHWQRGDLEEQPGSMACGSDRSRRDTFYLLKREPV